MFRGDVVALRPVNPYSETQGRTVIPDRQYHAIINAFSQIDRTGAD